ncbi:MAG: DUF5615 family PIN-like protein [Nostocales cyanobacterium 94392]|nr:DUF5615 family PIN-like protein [Nostocales cyanobacterium 94392]
MFSFMDSHKQVILNEIWEFAKNQEFCIVTQDADYAERSRLYGSPPKIIWLRCGNALTS